MESVYLGCLVKAPPADIAFEVYSLNKIKILICDYTKVS
jgi:hypothetical protein